MSNHIRKISVFFAGVILFVSLSAAADQLVEDFPESDQKGISQETGLNNLPYEDGDTIQGTVDVHWTEDDPDYVLCDQSCSQPTKLKWKIMLMYNTPSGETKTETNVAETDFGYTKTRKEGDNTGETLNQVTINTDHEVDTDRWQQLFLIPVLKPTGTTNTDPAQIETYTGNFHTIDSYWPGNDGGDDGGGDNGGGGSNSPPVPRLDVPAEVTVGESFTADASDSYDSDGSIASYDWDWSNDGFYENYGALETADYSYMSPGLREIVLRVEDDDGATSTITRSVDVTQDCPNKLVGTLNFLGGESKAAFWELTSGWGYTDTRTGCTYSHATPNSGQQYFNWGGNPSPVEASDTEPMVFDCVNGTTNELSGYNPPDDLSFSEQDYYFYSGLAAKTYCQHRVSEEAFEHVGETVPMVQYYIPTASIPYGAEGSEYVVDESTGEELPGFKTFGLSDLYTAMTRYDQDDNINTCEECENEATWLNKNMSETSAYSNPGPEKDGYQDAWVTDNMGGGKDPNIQDTSINSFTAGPDKEPLRDNEFPGGFGGNCQGILTWQYIRQLDEWRCDSDVPITQEIFMPTLDFPADQEGDKVRVGFFIMPQLFNTDERSPIAPGSLPLSFSQATDQSLIEKQTISQINAMCWWGDNDRFTDLQQENAGEAWVTVAYRNLPENIWNPLPVQGELDRTLRSEYGGEYSCKWTLIAQPPVKFSDLNVPDSETQPFDVYTTTGTVENVGSNIQDYVENRDYYADIDLEEEFRSPMDGEKFAEVAFEWQEDVADRGANRFDSSAESDQELKCKPPSKPFSEAENLDDCTLLNFYWPEFDI